MSKERYVERRKEEMFAPMLWCPGLEVCFVRFVCMYVCSSQNAYLSSAMHTYISMYIHPFIPMHAQSTLDHPPPKLRPLHTHLSSRRTEDRNKTVLEAKTSRHDTSTPLNAVRRFLQTNKNHGFPFHPEPFLLYKKELSFTFAKPHWRNSVRIYLVSVL